MQNYIIGGIFALIVIYITWRAMRGEKKKKNNQRKEDPGIRHLKNSLQNVINDGTLAAFEEEQMQTATKNINKRALFYSAITEYLAQHGFFVAKMSAKQLGDALFEHRNKLAQYIKEKTGKPMDADDFYYKKDDIVYGLTKSLVEERQQALLDACKKVHPKYLCVTRAGHKDKRPYGEDLLAECLRSENISAAHSVLSSMSFNKPIQGKKVGRWVIQIKYWTTEMLAPVLNPKETATAVPA